VEPSPTLSPARPLSDETARAIEAALGAHERMTVEVPERRKAAVLIMLFERDAEPWVVLTRRTETVSTHKGEISFPGGAHDDTDPDTWSTAVRESEEELGVDPASLTLLGALDDYPTFSSGFIVSPYVAKVVPQRWVANVHEIAEVIEVPLARLVAAARMEVWERDGVRFPMHIFEVDDAYVWGVTAFILRRFLDIVGPALGYVEDR
jgi:8-oxo-dGTP pyrophosphatase MutT (NUDIX family)